jgi:acetyl esterase/lipase
MVPLAELAPEYKYPSQIIETLAAYHYLVNTLGISEDKIVIGGDSAGGNLAEGFLLHLARPNPAIHVPAEFGPTPRRPGGALLISPFTKLISHLPSRKANVAHDLIDDGGSFTAALDYIGAKRPSGTTPVPSFNPVHLLKLPHPHPPRGIIKSAKGFTAEKEGKGLDLLSSPYVNPSVCEDLEWWNEAFPGEGRTMVTWGGKEIFCDDIVELVGVLNKVSLRSSLPPSSHI